MSDLRERLQSGLDDRYQLERELGRGGMATVFLATDLKHKRPVALKVLHPELAQTLGPERFQREIETAARLQHPHILTVLDSGEAGGYLWFTMPFVEGESLRDRLRRERQLPVEDAVRIAREAAQGLEYAHHHRVIHRDVKPENLLLTQDGNTLVADFGIARALGGGDQKLTESGMAVGTPAYMSPEQASADKAVDARTDVYSLGAVLYELLAGEPPFTGATAQAIIAKRFSGTVPSIRAVRPAVPEAVEQAVLKALALVPADRFATMADLTRALTASGTTASSPVPAAATRAVAAPTAGSGVLTSVARRSLFAMLALGFLLGLGALFAWGRSHGDTGGVRLVAVLPFEHQGDAADEYFSDGLSDEVRAKLADIPGLEVIARGSSTPYKRSPKSPQQIAQELGVRYLLTAVVRWEKTAAGASIVHVSPELVEVQGGSAPTSRWHDALDQPLTNVFQVQADIATRVAAALGVALGDSVKQRLAYRPTANLPAHDAFLRGEAATQGLGVGDPASLRQGIAAYEKAVALDSSYVEAWSRLARARAALYFLSTPTPAGAESARQAAERALTLAPNRPEGHSALAAYHRSVTGDNPRAFIEDSIAVAMAPNDAALLSDLGGPEMALGRWDAARTHLEQAARLDPRSGPAQRALGLLLLFTRHYPEARATLDRARGLAPTNLVLMLFRTMVELAQGDLVRARAVVAATPGEVAPPDLVAFLALYYDLMWVLDEGQQQLLLRLGPSAFDNDRGSWGIVRAQTYWLRGDEAKAHIYADSARLAFEEQLRATPNDHQRHVLLGLALAFLGQKAEAIAEGKRGVALKTIADDAYNGPYHQHQLARIYMLVGEPEQALDHLEPLLKIPSFLSPGWLKIDPNFAPLRQNPRFQRLVAETRISP